MSRLWDNWQHSVFVVLLCTYFIIVHKTVMVRLYPGLLCQSSTLASLKVTEDVTRFVVVHMQHETATSICEILCVAPLKCIRIL